MNILNDQDTFDNISGKCRLVSDAVWHDFTEFSKNSAQFDSRFPAELETLDYFKKRAGDKSGRKELAGEKRGQKSKITGFDKGYKIHEREIITIYRPSL